MLENFKKLAVFNPYHQVAAYFTPVLLIFMFGFFANYSVIRNTFQTTSDFNTVLKLGLILIAFTTLGKIFYEVTSRIVTLLYIVLFAFGSFLKARGSFLGSIGSGILYLVPDAHHKELSPLQIQNYLDKNRAIKLWYMHVKAYAYGIQTALGALLIGAGMYIQHRETMFFLAIIALLLTFSARKALLHTEVELENSAS